MDSALIVALAFLRNIVSSAELRCSVTKTTVERFRAVKSGCQTIVTVSSGKGARRRAQMEALRELGLVRCDLVARTQSSDTWAYEITPEGRRFQKTYFGVEPSPYAEVSEHCVGPRARMSF